MSHAARFTRLESGWLGRALGTTILVVLVLGGLGIGAVLSFAVTVNGDSMDPTLATGDRLMTNFLGRDDVHRFDLVDASPGGSEGAVVKRVIGLPGDTVWIDVQRNGRPLVRLIRAGSTAVETVVNPTWESQYGKKEQRTCCTADGASVKGARTVKGERAVVPDDAYWLLGDNWGRSTDSRVFGFVAAADLHATVNMRLLPLSRFGPIDPPDGIGLVPAEGR